MSLKLNSSGGGSVTLQEPTTASNVTLNLPATTGTVNTSGAVNEVPAGSASAPSIYPTGDTNTGIFFPAADTIAFTEGGAESGRFDSGGNFLVGATSRFSGFAADNKLYVESSTGDYICHFRSTQGTPYGPAISFSTAPNNTTSVFIDARDSSAQRFALRSNGGIANFSANNVNLSDERTKTDIQNAGKYLAKICAIPVRTFKYKDQTDNLLNLGVVAQEVETVAPELVDVSGFGETPEDGVPLKAIYQTDLQYALMKCIQEQQAMIEELKAKVAALEAE